MELITRKAIERVIAENLTLARNGVIDHHAKLNERMSYENPTLYQFIKARAVILETQVSSLAFAGYKDGASLTFRLLEAQALLEGTRLPMINEYDIDKMSQQMQLMSLLYKDKSHEKEFERITTISPEFGNYLLSHIGAARTQWGNTQQIEHLVLGFSLGAVTMYNLYEKHIIAQQ